MAIRSLKNGILTVTALIVLIASAAIAFMVITMARRVLFSEAESNARNQVSAASLAVENQFQSILFYRETTFARRKIELESLMDIALSILTSQEKAVLAGEITENEAKRRALVELRDIRYDRGIGYFWINDTLRPIPRMIMHPTIPELDGIILDDPSYETAEGPEKNLFAAALAVSEDSEGGFVSYKWPKPNPDGLSEEQQPKISYIRLFKPWDWVVGSGVYIDDIESESKARLDAVLEELRLTFGPLTIGKSGYYFLFDGTGKMLLHPLLEGSGKEAFTHPVTGENLIDKFIGAVNQGNHVVAYNWNMPDDPDNFDYAKLTFLEYFPPLDWYIASSVYVNDISAPISMMVRGIIILTSIAGILTISVILLTLRRMMRPLERLTASVETLDNHGLPKGKIPEEDPEETRRLGAALNIMVRSIENSQDYITGIMDAMPSLILGLNMQAGISSMNRKARSQHRGQSDPIHQDFSREFPEYQPLQDEIMEAISESRPWSLSNRPRESESGTIYESFSIFPLKDGAVLRVDDVTETVRLEEMMIQSEKMLSVGGLAAGMAHEINNPLAGIVQNTDVMARRLFDDIPANRAAAGQVGIELTTLHEYLTLRGLDRLTSNIRDSGLRAAELVRNMLSFSRKGDRIASTHNLASLLEKTVELFRTDYNLKKKFDFKSIEVVREFDNSIPPILCEGTKIQQVFLNIMKNAAEEMVDHGTWDGKPPRIILRIHKEQLRKKLVMVEIEDNGPGMEESIRRRIFEPFFTTKEVGEGTGLGLSVSYFIITENHGGTMSVDSRPGAGTRFTIGLKGPT